MILRPVSPQSPCGPPTTNRPGRIDVVRDLAVDQFLGQAGADDLLDDVIVNLLVRHLGRMLRGNDDRIDPHGPMAVELDRHLALAVGPQPIDFARLPGLGQAVQNAMGQARSAAASIRACRCRHSRTSALDRRRRFPCRPLDSRSRPGRCRGSACRRRPSRRRCRPRFPSDRRYIRRRESLAERPSDNRSCRGW